jgi:DNA-directed RNA polymerase subunit RPC12/RpoP
MMLFLSHAGADKPTVRRLGAHLAAVGGDVFFDEWSIAAGESIPGAIGTALETYDVFVMVWSAAMMESAWASMEYHAAVRLFVETPDRRLIVVPLDDTPIPPLVAHLKYANLRDEGLLGDVVNDLMGFRGNAQRIMAIQAFLEEGGLEVRYFHGYGPAVGCLKCGAHVDRLEGFSQTDFERDDLYAGVRCIECGWHDGGEIL